MQAALSLLVGLLLHVADATGCTLSLEVSCSLGPPCVTAPLPCAHWVLDPTAALAAVGMPFSRLILALSAACAIDLLDNLHNKSGQSFAADEFNITEMVPEEQDIARQLFDRCGCLAACCRRHVVSSLRTAAGAAQPCRPCTLSQPPRLLIGHCVRPHHG